MVVTIHPTHTPAVQRERKAVPSLSLRAESILVRGDSAGERKAPLHLGAASVTR